MCSQGQEFTVMKKYLIAVSAAALLSSTGAKAADIVTYQPEPLPIAPAFSWTGFYAGGELGGSWAEAKNRLRQNGETVAKKKLKPEGFIGGIFAGYNFQFTDAIVLGIDTDFLWDDVDDKKTFANGSRLKARQKWNGATRLRAGYAFDRFLPYIAAGVSYARLDDLYRGDDINKKKKKTRAGWNVGVGVDYIPPIFNDHIVLRAEYRFTDFGKKTHKLGDDYKYRVKYYQNDFRVGVAYKF